MRVPLNGAGLNPIIDHAAHQATRAANAARPAVFAPPVATFIGDRARERDLGNGLVLTVEADHAPAVARRNLEFVLGRATVVVASGGCWTDPETGEVEDKLHLHWRCREPPGPGPSMLRSSAPARWLAPSRGPMRQPCRLPIRCDGPAAGIARMSPAWLALSISGPRWRSIPPRRSRTRALSRFLGRAGARGSAPHWRHARRAGSPGAQRCHRQRGPGVGGLEPPGHGAICRLRRLGGRPRRLRSLLAAERQVRRGRDAAPLGTLSAVPARSARPRPPGLRGAPGRSDVPAPPRRCGPGTPARGPTARPPLRSSARLLPARATARTDPCRLA